MFHEYDKKGGYKDRRNLPKDSPKEIISKGLKELRKEIQLWKSEWQEKLLMDPIVGPAEFGK